MKQGLFKHSTADLKNAVVNHEKCSSQITQNEIHKLNELSKKKSLAIKHCFFHTILPPGFRNELVLQSGLKKCFLSPKSLEAVSYVIPHILTSFPGEISKILVQKFGFHEIWPTLPVIGGQTPSPRMLKNSKENVGHSFFLL